MTINNAHQPTHAADNMKQAIDLASGTSCYSQFAKGALASAVAMSVCSAAVAQVSGTVNTTFNWTSGEWNPTDQTSLAPKTNSFFATSQYYDGYYGYVSVDMYNVKFQNGPSAPYDYIKMDLTASIGDVVGPNSTDLQGNNNQVVGLPYLYNDTTFYVGFKIQTDSGVASAPTVPYFGWVKFTYIYAEQRLQPEEWAIETTRGAAIIIGNFGPGCNGADTVSPYRVFDAFDLFDFANKLVGSDTSADLDNDGNFDSDDLDTFEDLLNSGCP